MKATKSKSKENKSKSTFKVEVVHEPKASDILCGKDKSCVAHEGSVRFRKMIDQYRERYCSDSTSKQERMAITKEIVQKLSRSSRFIKYDTKDKVWKTISALAARDKVSHALRFANLKENRRTGKVKHIKRRVSSSGSDSNAKLTTPEDTELWNSLITRQSKLLESIKKGEKGEIPSIVELPEDITVATSTPTPASNVVEEIDCDPLSIDDSSHEETQTFQDYCLQLYRLNETEGDGTNAHDENSISNGSDDTTERLDYTSTDSSDDCDGSEKCLYEDNSDCDDDSPDTSISDDDRGDEIASMITEPLMEWDLEHDGIFEV